MHEPGTFTSDLDGLFQMGRRDDHVATHQFLHFDERAVGRWLWEGEPPCAEPAPEIDQIVLKLHPPLVELLVHRLHLRR